MGVFLSWSGTQSGLVATALHGFLTKLMENAHPFKSDEDIAAGEFWSREVAEALEQASVGVVCLTRTNQASPWVNFEAGAIAKNVSKGPRLIPYAIDIDEAGQVAPPLGQFQVKLADREGTWAMVRSINAALGKKGRDEKVLGEVFEKFWPELEECLAKAKTTEEVVPPPRDQSAMVEEILTTLRHVASQRDRELNLHNQAAEYVTSALTQWEVVSLSTPLRNTFRVWTTKPVPDLHKSIVSTRVREILDDQTRLLVFELFEPS